MAFDLSSAKPMSSGGFDLSSAKPVDAIPAQRKTQDTNAAVAFTAGLGTGVGTVALTVQDLVGRGLKVLGVDGAGNWLVEDAKKGKFKLSQEVKPYEETSPTATSAGKFTGEVAATLPVGGVIAAPLKVGAKVAPALKPIATAVESSGFQTGMKPGAVNALTRAAGGATSSHQVGELSGVLPVL